MTLHAHLVAMGCACACIGVLAATAAAGGAEAPSSSSAASPGLATATQVVLTGGRRPRLAITGLPAGTVEVLLTTHGRAGISLMADVDNCPARVQVQRYRISGTYSDGLPFEETGFSEGLNRCDQRQPPR